jgi:hypothetical protein
MTSAKYTPIDSSQGSDGRENILLFISLLGSAAITLVAGAVFAFFQDIDFVDGLIPSISASLWNFIMYPILGYVFSVSDSLLLCFVSVIGTILYVSVVLGVHAEPSGPEADPLTRIAILEIGISSAFRTLVIWISYMIPHCSGLSCSVRSIQYSALASAVGLGIMQSTWARIEELNQDTSCIHRMSVFLAFIPPICVHVWAALIGSAYIGRMTKLGQEESGRWIYVVGSFMVPWLMVAAFESATRILGIWTQPLIGLVMCIQSALTQKSIPL